MRHRHPGVTLVHIQRPIQEDEEGGSSDYATEKRKILSGDILGIIVERCRRGSKY